MYKYIEMKKEVFTEDGYRILESIKKNLENREVATVGELIKGISGDSWTMLACIDWLVESGQLKYVYELGRKQDWILKVVN